MGAWTKTTAPEGYAAGSAYRRDSYVAACKYGNPEIHGGVKMHEWFVFSVADDGSLKPLNTSPVCAHITVGDAIDSEALEAADEFIESLNK